jgi:uncharacterized protein (DUF302 family)
MRSACYGIIDTRGCHPFDQTVEKLKEILRSKGLKLFALVDHSGEAERVGIRMLPTKLMMFGNPKAGTPVMLAARRAALELPLKILVWQDAQERVWLSYEAPEYLQRRHGLPDEVVRNIAVLGKIVEEAAK